MEELLALAYVLSVLLVCSAIVLFLKRHVLSKRPLPTASREAGLAAMEIFQTADQRRAVEEVEFKKNDWKEEANGGDDLDTHLGKGRNRGAGGSGVVES